MQTSTSVLVIAVAVSTCAPTRTVHMFALAIPAMAFPGMDSAAQVCRSSWSLNENNMALFNVIDIDECTLEIDNCAHDCMNSHGSYTCSCQTGYTLDADGFTCNGLYS